MELDRILHQLDGLPQNTQPKKRTVTFFIPFQTLVIHAEFHFILISSFVVGVLSLITFVPNPNSSECFFACFCAFHRPIYAGALFFFGSLFRSRVRKKSGSVRWWFIYFSFDVSYFWILPWSDKFIITFQKKKKISKAWPLLYLEVVYPFFWWSFANAPLSLQILKHAMIWRKCA